MKQFIKLQSSAGVVLVACTVLALVLANSPLAAQYHALWETQISIAIGPYFIAEPALFWVTDFLMYVFFLFIGLEIKREVLIGELQEMRSALLPILGAAGGMVAPALIYAIFNPPGTMGFSGWAIPVATDIALVLGLLTVFGETVPASLRIFLATLAIADDIGGVLIMAVDFAVGLNLVFLSLGLLVVVGLGVLNKLGVRNYLPYIIGGVLIWICFFDSGVHPTIAGVLLAATIPATTRLELREFTSVAGNIVRRVDEKVNSEEAPDIASIFELMQTIEVTCRDAEAPLQRIEYALTAWVAFLVVPLFAFANSGVTIENTMLTNASPAIAMGIILGLVLGKPIGILTVVLLATKLGYADLPKDVDWNMMLGVGFLAGVALTISTLMASLSFSSGPELSLSKASILLGTAISAILGCYLMTRAVRLRKISTMPYQAPRSAEAATPPTPPAPHGPG